MPTVNVKRGNKSATKPAAKAAAPAKKSTGTRKTRADLVAVAPDVAKMRAAGKGWSEVMTKFGANGIQLRAALAEAGFDSKGAKLEVEKITGSGKSLATKVAKARRNGEAFYILALGTGKSEAELKALLSEHGFSDEASGRIYKTGEGASRGR